MGAESSRQENSHDGGNFNRFGDFCPCCWRNPLYFKEIFRGAIMVALLSLLASRLGGWVVGGLVALVLLGILKLEHNAKLKAQARAATAEQGMKIGYESYIKLYQEREQIKDKAGKERRKLHELEKVNDLSGLRDDFNQPGVRRPRGANPPGSPQAPATYYDPAAPGTQYQEAP